jgi:bacteriocin biosynthesis cyclodehydratase domain-containing protein
MAEDLINAVTMAQAAQYDPQFAVPVRPRVRRGVVVRRHADRLICDGTAIRHVLSGADATRLVPMLLPLLDGARGHDDLATQTGLDPSAVSAVLALLWTCGVIEEATPTPAPDTTWVPDHLADFLSRVGDITAANAAWEQAAHRLDTARVEVFGDADLVASLRSAVGTSMRLRIGAGGRPSPDTTLVLLATVDEVVMPEDQDLADRCWQASLPLLRVDLSGRVVQMGPYVDPRLGACLDCLIHTSEAPLDTAESAEYPAEPTPGVESAPGSEPGRADDLVLAGALAAADLVGLHSRATRVPLPGRWSQVDLDQMAAVHLTGTTRPGCPTCSNEPDVTLRQPPLCARYEAAVALPAHEFADRKAHQAHYQPANVALQRGHKTWPGAPREKLPEPDLTRLEAAWPTRPTTATEPGDDPAAGHADLEALSILLAIGAGWQEDRPERVRRWTASGGNIGSVVAHLVAWDLSDLAPGVYGYIPATHELALLRRGRPGIPAPADATATLVLTAALPRVAYKYGPFGLRIVLLDAGCAQAAISAATQVLSLQSRWATRWADEAIAECLGTDCDAEPVTAVLHLR